MTMTAMTQAHYRNILKNALESLAKLVEGADNLGDENVAGDCTVNIDFETGAVTITPEE